MGIRVLIGADEIAAALPPLACRIEAAFTGEAPVCTIVLLEGARPFARDLLRLLPGRFTAHPLKVSSYGNGRQSSGSLQWHDRPPEVKGRQMLLLDDVLDSGLTLSTVSSALLAAGAESVRSAVAVEKKGIARTGGFRADFHLFRLGGGFLVGYGMDCAGRCRELPFIGLKEK